MRRGRYLPSLFLGREKGLSTQSSPNVAEVFLKFESLLVQSSEKVAAI